MPDDDVEDPSRGAAPTSESLERDIARIESELEELGDPELAPPVPAGTLAAMASSTTPVASSPSPRRNDRAREIVRLAWPIMASQVLMNLTGLVDRMMIGRLADEGSAAIPLAAVGYATQLFFLIQSTLLAVGLACVALMARAIGSGDPQRARHAFAASIQVSAVVTFTYVVILYGGGDAILRALGAEASVIDVALPYLELTLGAALMLSLTVIVESAMRANRDTRTPMVIAVIVTISKLGLNAVFIFGLFGWPRMELVGAGLATLVSQAIGLCLFVALLSRVARESPTGLRIRDLVRRNPVARDVIRIAVPGIAERLVLNFGLLSYFWILSRWYGTLAVAAYTVGVALLSFSWIPGHGYAQACATLVGQSLGADRSDDAERIGWRTIALALGTAIPVGVFCGVYRFELAGLFTDDLEVIQALGPFMLTLAIAQPFLQLHFTLGGVHRGAGDTVTPLVAAIIGNWVFRVPIAIFVGGWLELDVIYVWMALVVDHIARTSTLAVSFIRGRWKRTSADLSARSAAATRNP